VNGDDLLENLTRTFERFVVTSNTTAAALFRSIDQFKPTLLVDELDTFIQAKEELRGILNSGHTRATAHILRCVGHDHEPRPFSTWAPKALAMIGQLPETLRDCVIVVRLKRKRPMIE